MVENEPTPTEVLVVGGGPIGLCATLALGRLDVNTVVLEWRGTISTHPRGHVENRRTMELFRLWGSECIKKRGQIVERSSAEQCHYVRAKVVAA